jgi:hypothetical protein
MLVAAALVIPLLIVEQTDVGEPWATVSLVLNWWTSPARPRKLGDAGDAPSRTAESAPPRGGALGQGSRRVIGYGC